MGAGTSVDGGQPEGGAAAKSGSSPASQGDGGTPPPRQVVQPPSEAPDAEAVARRRKELGLDDDDDDDHRAPSRRVASGTAARQPTTPQTNRSARATMLASSALGRSTDQAPPCATASSSSPPSPSGAADTATSSSTGGSGTVTSPTRQPVARVTNASSDQQQQASPDASRPPGGSMPRTAGQTPATAVRAPTAHSWSPGASFQRRRIKLFSGQQVGTWHKGAIIGKGATGAVYEATDDATHGYFAVKEVEFAEDFADNPEDRRRFEALRAEVSVLQLLDHPNVVRFLGIDRVGFNMYIMMEFVAGGSIAALVKRFSRLPDGLTARYTAQIVAGLSYLHGKNIIHRDIKGANILVSDDGVVKLADFGTAKRIIDPEQLQRTLAGTPYWMAPEVVRQEGHAKPADVWSLGATVLQMLTGSAPYQELATVPALFKIGHGSEVPVPAQAEMSPNARDFVTRCLTRDAARRPTLSELALHPWLTEAGDSLMGSRREDPAAPPPYPPYGPNGAGGRVGGVTPPSSVASPPASVTVAAEGEVTEYLIALSFVHDDDVASAALDQQRTTTSSAFGSPGMPQTGKGAAAAVGAVTFDAPLSHAAGRAAADDDDDADLPEPEFDDENFNNFVDTLSK